MRPTLCDEIYGVLMKKKSRESWIISTSLIRALNTITFPSECKVSLCDDNFLFYAFSITRNDIQREYICWYINVIALQWLWKNSEAINDFWKNNINKSRELWFSIILWFRNEFPQLWIQWSKSISLLDETKVDSFFRIQGTQADKSHRLFSEFNLVNILLFPNYVRQGQAKQNFCNLIPIDLELLWHFLSMSMSVNKKFSWNILKLFEHVICMKMNGICM